MADNQEYNNLVNERNRKQGQYAACQNRIESVEYLLGRLRPAKAAVQELKKTFKTIRKEDADLKKEKTEWKGDTYNMFSGKMYEVTATNDRYYTGSLDHVLDELNNEITRLENKRMREHGLLGELGAAINSLANKIENFFN